MLRIRAFYLYAFLVCAGALAAGPFAEAELNAAGKISVRQAMLAELTK